MILAAKLAIPVALFYISKGLKTKNTADKLDISLDAVKWNGWSGGGINFDIKLNVNNPTGFDITLNYLYLNLYLEKLQLTTINKENWNKIIRREHREVVNVPVKLYLTSLLRLGWNLIKMFQAGKKPGTMRIEGTVRANNFRVDINETVNIL